MQFHHSVAAATLLLALAGTLAHAQSQAFTYQGELRSGNNLAQGPHDLRFELLDAGGVVRQTLCADNVPVQEGRFTVLLDPGIEFPGLLTQLTSIRILVRANAALPCSDTSGFTALSPTQPFTRAPLASRASLADRALTTDTFGGQTPSFYSDAANLSGVLADARLSSNVPRIAANNVFSGANRFGSIGIGTEFPLFPLSITSIQATAYLATTGNLNGSVLVLENNSPNIFTTGGLLGAVNFNASGSTPGQLSYRLDAAGPLAHSMQFRVGGINWAVLTGAGSLGVGVFEPAARLHVRNGSSFTTPNPNSTMVMETANGGYFSLITQDDRETGLLFGNSVGGAEDAGIIYNNPGTPSGLEFRTGGNVTQMTISGTGVVNIPGTLVSANTVVQDVQYATPKITFATITPADFRVASIFSSTVSLGFGEYATIPSGFVSDQLTAGVNLPNGAVVTQVIVWMYDNSSTKNLTAQFVQVDQFTRSPALRGTGTSGTSSILNQAIDCTPVPNLTINNENSFYRIVVSTANNQPWDGNLGVAGVRIEYEMSSPIP
jgi:hypothetical protein